MIRYLAAAGIVGPVLYTVTWLVLGFLDPMYRHTRDPISNLSATGAPYAQVMTSIILVFALLIVVFAYGLQRGLPSGFWAGPVTLAIAGLGYVGIAFAPLNLVGLGHPNVPHTISASVTVFAMMLAPLFLYPRLRRNPGWKIMGGYSIATTLLAFAVAILASLPTFANWEGLMQRLVLSVLLVWMIAIAISIAGRKRQGA